VEWVEEGNLRFVFARECPCAISTFGESKPRAA
jgi:hypothetical protein